jgi:hypothetical protein
MTGCFTVDKTVSDDRFAHRRRGDPMADLEMGMGHEQHFRFSPRLIQPPDLPALT